MQASDTTPENKKTFPGSSPGHTSIPILMGDKVISVKDLWYMLRLTPMDAYSIEAVEKMLIDVMYSENYIISTEVSPKKKLHFHVVFTCEFPPRDNIKLWLSEKFPGAWKKEDGNKRYNLEEVTDLKKCITYCVKDGTYCNSISINPDFLVDCKSKSFNKYSKEAFTVAFELLKTKYKDGEITSRELRTSIIQLKGLYRQPINLTRIGEIVLACMVNKDPTLAETL